MLIIQVDANGATVHLYQAQLREVARALDGVTEHTDDQTAIDGLLALAGAFRAAAMASDACDHSSGEVVWDTYLAYHAESRRQLMRAYLAKGEPEGGARCGS